MALTSELFKDNNELQACALRDTAHIVADEPPLRRGVNNQGPHIALIHTALRRVMANPIFGLEEATETYGPLTAEVIRQFKAAQTPPILNLALRQTTPDNIVGRLTIAALDRAVTGRKNKGGGGGPANTKPFTVVPFTETSPFLISQQKDNRSEDDLDFAKRPPKGVPRDSLEKIGLARGLPTLALETEMLTELSGGGQIGRDMGNTFIRNNAVQVVSFDNDSSLSKAIRSSFAFAPVNDRVRDQISTVLKEGIASRRVVDFHDLAEARKVIDPPVFGFSFKDRKLKFAIGGMKGADLFLTQFDAGPFPRRWTGTLQYDFFDHFGINDSDTILDTSGHGSFGQAAMWVMQHERHPGHFPFISKITVIVDVSGAL